jgi:hypothetical protein
MMPPNRCADDETNFDADHIEALEKQIETDEALLRSSLKVLMKNQSAWLAAKASVEQIKYIESGMPDTNHAKLKEKDIQLDQIQQYIDETGKQINELLKRLGNDS